jgi:hypothetical protein
MLILVPVLVVENNRRSLPTAPAKPVIGAPEDFKFSVANPEVTLAAPRVVTGAADRAAAFAAFREFRLRFVFVADTADHRASRSRSHAATRCGSNLIALAILNAGILPC